MEKMLGVVHKYSWRGRKWSIGEEEVAGGQLRVPGCGVRKRTKVQGNEETGKIEDRRESPEGGNAEEYVVGLGTKEALRSWDTVGRPVMEYGSEVWATGGWKLTVLLYTCCIICATSFL